MQKHEIEKSVIFGVPVIKTWPQWEEVPPKYYLDNDSKMYFYSYTDQLIFDEVNKLEKEDQKKFAPLICGFNPGDMHAVDHIRTVFERNPDFWRGIGEIFFRHDDITHLTYGEAPRPNMPSIKPIMQFAAEKNLPVVIHHNASADWVGSNHPETYIGELEEMLAFSDAKVVWAHCGYSRRNRFQHCTGVLRKFLKEYDNLFLDISWVCFDHILDESHRPVSDWIELIEEFSDRIMLGSDLVGEFSKLGEEMGKFDKLLGFLSDSTVKKIAFENADQLFFFAKN